MLHHRKWKKNSKILKSKVHSAATSKGQRVMV